MFTDLQTTLQADFPEFNFKLGPRFAFRPPKTIILDPLDPNPDLPTLHELAHALLGHFSFDTHVERLKMEVDAWAKTRSLAQKYHVKIDEDLIESDLGSYRNWLHTKSTCKKCGLTRYQSPDGAYHCPFCDH